MSLFTPNFYEMLICVKKFKNAEFLVILSSICALISAVNAADNSNPGRKIVFDFGINVKLGFSAINPDTTISLSGKFYLQGTRNLGYPYQAQFYNVSLTNVDKNGKKQYLEECESMKNVKKALELPFEIIYNSFYVVKGLKFSSKDTELSKNIKFVYLTDIHELDVEKVERNNPWYTAIANETTVMGYCELKYTVKREQISEKVINNSISKKYTDKCIKKAMNEEDYTLGDICNPRLQKNLQFDMHNNRLTQLNNSVSTVIRAEETDVKSYYPWKGSDKRFHMSVSIKAHHDKTLNISVQTDPTETNPELIKAVSLSKPDKGLINEKNSKKNKQLIEVLRALGCDASVETIVRQLVEELARCL